MVIADVDEWSGKGCLNQDLQDLRTRRILKGCLNQDFQDLRTRRIEKGCLNQDLQDLGTRRIEKIRIEKRGLKHKDWIKNLVNFKINLILIQTKRNSV